MTERSQLTINPKVLTVVIVLLFQLADIATTYVGMKRYGLTEQNPLASYVMQRQGFAFAAVLKMSVMLLVCMNAMHNGRSMHLAAGISAGPAVSNLLAIIEKEFAS